MQINNKVTSLLHLKLRESLKRNDPQLQRNNSPSSFIKLKSPNPKLLDLVVCWLKKYKLTSNWETNAKNSWNPPIPTSGTTSSHTLKTATTFTKTSNNLNSSLPYRPNNIIHSPRLKCLLISQTAISFPKPIYYQANPLKKFPCSAPFWPNLLNFSKPDFWASSHQKN